VISDDVSVAAIGAVAAITSLMIQVRYGSRIKETHRQVNVNGHSQKRPTVLDGLSDVLRSLEYLIAEVHDGKATAAELAAKLDNLESQMTEHMAESPLLQAEFRGKEAEIWRALSNLRDRD
jgi:hypothetical protein